jgi:hypothetical protein
MTRFLPVLVGARWEGYMACAVLLASIPVAFLAIGSPTSALAQGVDCSRTYARECVKKEPNLFVDGKLCLEITVPLLERAKERGDRIMALWNSGFDENKAQICRLFREDVRDKRRHLPLIRKNCVYGAHKGQASFFQSSINIQNNALGAQCGRA